MIKKLNSNRGASLIIALVYFVVSMSIGAAILSMALANISRVKAEKKMENSYLAVRSAAELYQEKIASINAAGKTEYRMNPDTKQLDEDGEQKIKKDLRKSICVKKEDDSKLPLPTELSKLIYDVFLSKEKFEKIFLDYDTSSIGGSKVQAQIFIVPDGIVSADRADRADQMQVKVYAVFSPEGGNLKDEEKCYITVEGIGIINYQLTENVEIELREKDSEGNTTTEEIEHYSYDANVKISMKDFYTYKGKYTAGTGG